MTGQIRVRVAFQHYPCQREMMESRGVSPIQEQAILSLKHSDNIAHLWKYSCSEKSVSFAWNRSEHPNIMSDLTVEKIIEIHDEIIRQFDGAQGILSESTLHFMIFRVNKFEDIFRRAAIVLHAIGSQHRSWTGTNGQHSLLQRMFSKKLGLYIAADEDTIVRFMLNVASYRLEPDAIEQWLKDHAKIMEN